MPFLMNPSSKILRAYEDLKRAAEAAGFRGEVRWLGDTDGILFHVEQGGRWSKAFWVGKREPGPILHLRCAVYRVTDPGRLTDVCLILLRRVKEGASPPWVDPDLEREFGLVPLERMEYHDAEREEQARRLSKTGWCRVPPEEDSLMTDRVWAFFFCPGVSPLRVRIPEEALGWDISSAYVGGEATQRLGYDLTFKSIQAFRRALRPGEHLYAFEFRSTGWYFDPRADVTDATCASLAVPVLPEAGTVFFVTLDFRLGLIGVSPGEKMYIFGADLIEAFGTDWPDAFARPIPVERCPGGKASD